MLAHSAFEPNVHQPKKRVVIVKKFFFPSPEAVTMETTALLCILSVQETTNHYQQSFSC